MPRHGMEAHFLRPDGVYITSVLQPTLAYDPVRDSQEVGARFVAPSGLAGPMASIHLLGRHRRRRKAHLNGLGASWSDRWKAFVARIRTNVTTNKFLHDMRVKSLPATASAVAQAIHATSTLPRPPAPSPDALPTQSGWAPPPQSRASQAAIDAHYKPDPQDPPKLPAVVTAVKMAPNEAAFPANFWAKVIYGGYSPLVASRAESDALARFYDNRLPIGGSGY